MGKISWRNLLSVIYKPLSQRQFTEEAPYNQKLCVCNKLSGSVTKIVHHFTIIFAFLICCMEKHYGESVCGVDFSKIKDIF